MFSLRPLLRHVIVALLALIAIAAPALAGDRRVALAEPCVLVTSAETTLDPSQLIADPTRFDCVRSQIGNIGPLTWALFHGIDVTSDPGDPWELRHTNSQATAETIWVRYADGSVVHAPSDRTTARRHFSPGRLSFALPPRDGRITDILIRTEGLQNQRGVAAQPELITGRAALASDLTYLLVYGILAGSVIALFFYNLSLYAALRYPFLLFYCVTSLLMLLTGLAWSGGIYEFVPDMTATTQISFAMLGMSVTLMSVVLFMLTFLEREVIDRRAAAFTVVAALVGIAASTTRLCDVHFAWKTMDLLTYGAITAVVIGVFVTTLIAALRGSIAGRNYLIAWSIPIVLTVFRSVWALGYIPGESVLIEISPLVIMAIEALMSAIAVGWRIARIRTERDDARALEGELRALSETDALTGLLNRRAFIDRAEATGGNQSRRLILIDIDQFKLVNDRHGHVAGDDVLVTVASVLRATAPTDALIGRLGGEEFAVLVPATPVDALADRLCRAVGTAATADGLTVTISVGVADRRIANEGDWRLIFYAADHALYRSKNGGRNRVSHAPQAIAA